MHDFRLNPQSGLRLARLGMLLALILNLSAVHAQAPSSPAAGARPSAPCQTDCERAPAEVDFSPPPVPAFMLSPPKVPLTLEQMVEQAREAERRSRPPVFATPPRPGMPPDSK